MNREYKSDVFSMLMMQPEYALDVYNALNETKYDDPGLIEILQLEKGISLTVRNDASFIIDFHLNLYEHQSTYNPNIPLRSLIYLAHHLEQLLKDKNLFGRNRIPIPTIHCVVFYNGIEKRPAKEILKLSDSFIHKVSDPDAEVICTMININKEFSEEYSASSVLSGYSQFVDKVRTYQQMMDVSDALEQAIDECTKEGILSDFFRKHRQEVLKIAMLDYTFERQIELEKRDSFAEGKIEGKIEGKAEMVILMAQDLGWDDQQIINYLMKQLSLSYEDAKHTFEEINIFAH